MGVTRYRWERWVDSLEGVMDIFLTLVDLKVRSHCEILI